MFFMSNFFLLSCSQKMNNRVRWLNSSSPLETLLSQTPRRSYHHRRRLLV
eukprot:UN00018